MTHIDTNQIERVSSTWNLVLLSILKNVAMPYKHLCDNLLNVDETQMELPTKLT
jgi:hypothetical protein